METLKTSIMKWGSANDDLDMAKRKVKEAEKKVNRLESERTKAEMEVITSAEALGFFNKKDEIFFTYRGQISNEVVLAVSKETKSVTSVPGVRIK